MQILNGNEYSRKIKEEIKSDAQDFITQTGVQPHLAAILVGDDGASITYVNHKIKSCQEVGFKSSLFRYESSITEEELIEKINEINADDSIHGLIVQLPLPKHINVDRVIETVDHRKDVDGFHPLNIGRMVKNMPSLLPATPMGIMMMISYYGIETRGKKVVVIGRSQIVGTPVSLLLSRQGYPGDSTVTLCHRYTANIENHTKEADIIISAVGIPEFIKGDMVKEGATVIDVGITRIEAPEKKSGFILKGDVDFESVAPKCSYITPVPGGIGPMTIVALLLNTLKAARNEIYNPVNA